MIFSLIISISRFTLFIFPNILDFIKFALEDFLNFLSNTGLLLFFTVYGNLIVLRPGRGVSDIVGAYKDSFVKLRRNDIELFSFDL